jgi:hypothetical protein
MGRDANRHIPCGARQLDYHAACLRVGTDRPFAGADDEWFYPKSLYSISLETDFTPLRKVLPVTPTLCASPTNTWVTTRRLGYVPSVSVSISLVKPGSRPPQDSQSPNKDRLAVAAIANIVAYTAGNTRLPPAMCRVLQYVAGICLAVDSHQLWLT